MSTEIPARGRLIFDSGASNLTIVGSTSIDSLYESEFEGFEPEVVTQGGDVHIKYPRFSPLEWVRNAFSFRHMSAHITLNARIPWEIECHGGLAHFTGDLETLRLAGFHLHGGASVITMHLGQPEGNVAVQFFGGMSTMSVDRPGNVPTHLKIIGGTAGLRFDDQGFGAMGGQMTMHSRGDASARGEYAIEISGGAANISVMPRGA